MIVKCIDAKHAQGLTQNKKYKVERYTRNTYVVINDRGCTVSVKKENFKKKSWIHRFFN